MRARYLWVFVAVAMLGLALPIGGCGDNDNSGDCRDCGQTLVYVDGAQRPGTACPPGTTEAYREGNVIVCDSCATDDDCDGGRRCSIQCGPGCEDDTSGCCPVRGCLAVSD